MRNKLFRLMAGTIASAALLLGPMAATSGASTTLRDQCTVIPLSAIHSQITICLLVPRS
jgi:hypothetical protein